MERVRARCAWRAAVPAAAATTRAPEKPDAGLQVDVLGGTPALRHKGRRMLLTLLLLVPVVRRPVCCLVAPSRAWWERLNLAAFAVVAGLALQLAGDVRSKACVSVLGGFLRADALSALVIGLIGFVALVCAIYAVGYFRHDARAGKITDAQLRHYYG